MTDISKIKEIEDKLKGNPKSLEQLKKALPTWTEGDIKDVLRELGNKGCVEVINPPSPDGNGDYIPGEDVYMLLGTWEIVIRPNGIERRCNKPTIKGYHNQTQ